jgi:hypothetical protein
MWQVTSDKCRWGERPREPKCDAKPGSSVASPHLAIAANRQSSPVTRHAGAQRGMALVITLIMLAVTLVMAVAFLAIARRERNAVTTTTDTATARLATDAALASAQAQIAANILASGNLGAYNYSLLVSTNYINSAGFNPLAAPGNPTNVNYDYLTSGGPLATADETNQNIANLWLLPRAPVFVYNRNIGSNDFRFYLDANRNGRFEPNYPDFATNAVGQPILDANNNPVLVTNVGDPEWVGVLERPDQPHSANNHFIARYAFLAQPIGNSLDLNYIHNQVLNPNNNLPFASDGFFRNQGVGSWELNLAAFLADLNTNIWGQVVGSGASAPLGSASYYQYFATPGGGFNAGVSFNDALSLLSWRYNFSYANLATANDSFANPFNYPYAIDGYSDGPLQTTVDTNISLTPDNRFLHWAGGNNTNNNANSFFALPSEAFGASQNLGNFPKHLEAAGTNVSTYDRYTFYRLLDQLGTDSTADSGKLNLNYSNAVVSYNNLGVMTSVAIIPGAETNLVPWAATNFFHAAADRLLRAYTTNWFAAGPSNYLATYYNLPYNAGYYAYIDSLGRTNAYSPTGLGLTNQPFFGMTNQIPAFGVGNIPVFVNSNFVYAPAVNRLLQLAANIYDASTNRAATLPHDYPSVFRPLFSRDANGLGPNVYITGFTNLFSASGPDTVSGPDDNQLAPPMDIQGLSLTNVVVKNLAVNIYGVPWIIGAKKGFPNFNNFTVANSVGLSRRLQLTRDTNSVPYKVTGTNQMYVMNVSDGIGYDFWNSYNSNYNGTIYGQVRLNLTVVITNDEGYASQPLVYANPYLFAFNPFAFVTTNWPGSAVPRGYTWPSSRSFITNTFAVPFLANMVYRTPTATPPTYSPPGFLAPVNSQSTPPGFVATNYFYPGFVSQDFETNNPNLTFPHFGELATNRLQVYLLDYTNKIYRVVDYAHYKQEYTRDLTSEIFNDDADGNNVGVWNTNIDTATGVPYGIENQIHISLGNLPTPFPQPVKDEDGAWHGDPEAVPLGGTPPQQQASFQAFMLGGKWTATASVAAWGGDMGATGSNHLSSAQAPYSPTKYVISYTAWQANDPLVHYLASDMTPSSDLGLTTKYFTPPPAGSLMSKVSIGQLNKNYQPWGGNPKYTPIPGEVSFYTETANNLTMKDPLVWGSDNWDFPTNQYPTVGWLGRVHRGTPWQTVYLKASDILKGSKGSATWAQWTGDAQYYDAANSAPVQDRQLFDLFTTRFNDNAAHGTLSVNQTHLAAWSAVFGGMVALSNSTAPAVWSSSIHPVTTNFTIDPAGVVGSSSSLGLIVNSINTARAGYTNADGLVGTFENTGDILRAPLLTEQSPFLNWSDSSQAKFGISDAMYEWLPQQALGLLRASGTTRYVVYCYGQTLRPAANSLVTAGGNYFGLCTNYQITAESAARAVIRVDRQVTTTGTNYSTVVESFNPLPPN